MNQAELINKIALKTGAEKKVIESILKAEADVGHGELQEGGEVTLPGLGKLSVKAKPARKGRNPKTGEEIDIPARNAPHFSATKALKDAVNG